MSDKSIATVLEDSSIKFGTSGARGLVEQFTDEVSGAFAIAFVYALRSQNIQVDRIALGIDRRPSSPSIAAAIAGALQSVDCVVDYYGVLPTPALALQSLHDGIPAIMVTGSHIPFDRNGIKFYRPNGEITKQDETLILNQNKPLLGFKPDLPEISMRAVNTYISRYVSPFTCDTLKGCRIGLYEHSAAGRDVSRCILESLGAEVISLGKTNIFVPIDTEAVTKEDQDRALTWSESFQLDAIFSTDGDGDRPLIADENGIWLKGDVVGMLCARIIGVEALSIPVSCNSSAENYTQIPIARTKIGSPFVIESMTKQLQFYSTVAGFEANGGFLCATPFKLNNAFFSELPTRDAILPLIALLTYSLKNKLPLSDLAEQAQAVYTSSDRLTAFSTKKSQAFIEKWSNDILSFIEYFDIESSVVDVNTLDGLRIKFENNQVMHLRPSGNAPELRCYCESDTQNGADKLLIDALGKLTALR